MPSRSSACTGDALTDRFSRLRKLAAGAVALWLGLLSSVATLPASGGEPKPQIVVPEEVYDFGETFAGEHMDHVFTIRNEGTAPLELSDESGSTPTARPSPPASALTGDYRYRPERSSGPRLTAVPAGFSALPYGSGEPVPT